VTDQPGIPVTQLPLERPRFRMALVRETPNFGGQIMQTAISNLRELLPVSHFRKADQARFAFCLAELEDLKREYGFREES
jgi:hypothetical protein